mgnify:CR=1 FL=1
MSKINLITPPDKLKNDLDAVIIGQSKKRDGSFPVVEKKILKFILLQLELVRFLLWIY